MPELTGAAVLVVARSVPPAIGGEEGQISRLSSLMVESGATVEVWTTTESPSLPIGVRVRVRPRAYASMPLYLLWLVSSVAAWRLCHPSQPCVLVTTRVSGDSALLARLSRVLRIPVVMFLTGGLSGGSEFALQRRNWVRSWIARGSAMVIAHSALFIDEVRLSGFSGPSRTVDAIVDIAHTHPCTEGFQENDTGRPRLLWCGRNDPVKDLPALSRLMAGSLQSIGSASLLIVIDEAPVPSVSRAQVHLCCPDPAAHMAAADVLLLTSRFEGQGAVIGEAAVEGTPTVAYAVGGIPEIVQRVDCGETMPLSATDAEFAACVERVWLRFVNPAERKALTTRADRIFRREPRQAWVEALSQVIPPSGRQR